MLTVRFQILAILLLSAFPLFGQSARLSLELDREIYLDSARNNLYLQATINVEGDSKALPKDIVFLVDLSGSMQGEKLEQTKIAIRQGLTQLSSSDSVTVITFGSSIEIPIPPTPVDKLGSLIGSIENLTSEGGSSLYEGIETALNLLRDNRQDTRLPRIILIADGPPNKGPRDAASFASLFSHDSQSSLEFTSLYLAEGATEQEKNSLSTLMPTLPTIVENTESLTQVLVDSITGEHAQMGTDAILEIAFELGIEIEESIGRESEISGRKIRFQLGNLRANQELKAITQATMSASKSIHSRTKIASATLTYNTSPQGEVSPTVIKQEIYADFSPNAEISFESIQSHVYQSICEGEVSDILIESNQWLQQGNGRKALREIRKLSRDIRSVASDLPELQIDESINQLNLAIRQIEDTLDSSIERAARDETLYPSATLQNNE